MFFHPGVGVSVSVSVTKRRRERERERERKKKQQFLMNTNSLGRANIIDYDWISGKQDIYCISAKFFVNNSLAEIIKIIHLLTAKDVDQSMNRTALLLYISIPFLYF